jgi:hypothetical protein
VTATAIADAHPARTEPPAPTGPAGLDPDAGERGRHNADGHDGEVRIPVDGHDGGGRHGANGHDGERRAGESVETDPTAEPVHGRPSAGT